MLQCQLWLRFQQCFIYFTSYSFVFHCLNLVFLQTHWLCWDIMFSHACNRPYKIIGGVILCGVTIKFWCLLIFNVCLPACVRFYGQLEFGTDRILSHILDIWTAFPWSGCICKTEVTLRQTPDHAWNLRVAATESRLVGQKNPRSQIYDFVRKER